jgi:hypothetical protein
VSNDISQIEPGFYFDSEKNYLHVNGVAEDADTGGIYVIYLELQGERKGKMLARRIDLFRVEMSAKGYRYRGKNRRAIGSLLKPGTRIDKKV